MTEELEKKENINEIQEIISDDEYAGIVESESNYESSENINLIEKPIIEKPKNYTFKWLKDFNGAINYPFLNQILNNESNLLEILKLQLDSLDDDDLIFFCKNKFPKILLKFPDGIICKQDRENIHFLIEVSNEVGVSETGQHILNIWNEDFANIILILDKNESIVGVLSVKHANKLACYINIKLRPINPTLIEQPLKRSVQRKLQKKNRPLYTVPVLVDKPRAKVAIEMVKYFGARYAKKIYDQGYKYILACTLDIKSSYNKPNMMPKQVLEKECKIISNKLRNEQSLASDKIDSEAFKLSPGFHLKGTGLPRFHEGKIAFEENWQYNLGKKFEHI